jgi:alginate O-acetyltransferase complex protein AlgI
MTASLLDVRFLILLTLVCMCRAFWPRRHYALLGALASATLVALGSVQTFLAIAGITILYIFPVHRLMRASAHGERGALRRRLLLGIGIAGLVGLLITFKIYNAFSIPMLGGRWLDASFVSLVGFSYFLFRAISFLHIQSILDFNERSPWGLLYYFLFPPTLTSGPIQKYQDFNRQLNAPEALTWGLASSAVYRITRGYFRKLVLAGALNGIVEWLLAQGVATPLTSLLVVVALYLYFYFDFAGYSDIAISFGLLLGIRVPENFKKPFLATSVTEFWRNWHISLVDWFRDHVFIPLGGMSGSRLRSGALAFLIMVLCGLWHGLTKSFLIWGLWHGTMLFLEAVTGSRPMAPSQRHGWVYWSRVLWTNARVAIASLLFLPQATIQSVIRGFVNWS